MLAVAVILVMSSYFTVDPNEVGAVLRFSRRVSDQPVPPGLHFKLPVVVLPPDSPKPVVAEP